MEAERTNSFNQHWTSRHDSKVETKGSRGNRYATCKAKDFSRWNFLQRQQFGCFLQFADRRHGSPSNQGTWWTQKIILIKFSFVAFTEKIK
jgi:hypothetical protein